MPRKPNSGGINKSQAIRDLLKDNPHVSAKEAISTLAQSGIKVNQSLFYFVKGKAVGRRGRRRKMRRQVADIMATSNGTVANRGDVLSTIKKVKGLATELGGLKKLQALVDALLE
jgi:hypothetical protein